MDETRSRELAQLYILLRGGELEAFIEPLACSMEPKAAGAYGAGWRLKTRTYGSCIISLVDEAFGRGDSCDDQLY